MRSSTAGMSEARIVSPLPSPTTSGEETFTPTSSPGWAADSTTSEYAPSRRATTDRTAAVRSCSPSSAASIRCATTSVSVSETNPWPSFSSETRSSWWFSTMPLWITATRPEQSRCGWALSSVGGPCVAQRVWPIAVVPPAMGSAASAASSSDSLPARLRTVRPSVSTATPAESYPRYSSRRRPSRTIGSASSAPTYPTMPHIASSLTGQVSAPAQASIEATTAAIASACVRASSSVSASTMTRTSGSVPLGRSRTRPRVAERVRGRGNRRRHRGRGRHRLAVGDVHVHHHLRVAAHHARQLAERRARRGCERQEPHGGEQPVPGRRVPTEDHVAALLAAEDEPAALHRFEHVAVAHLRPQRRGSRARSSPARTRCSTSRSPPPCRPRARRPRAARRRTPPAPDRRRSRCPRRRRRARDRRRRRARRPRRRRAARPRRPRPRGAARRIRR